MSGALQRGPPSIQASRPSGSATSAAPPTTAPSRAAFSPHHQIGVPDAGVVVVGPDQVVEAVQRQVEISCQRVRRINDRLRLAELLRIDCELDHDRLARRPALVEHRGDGHRRGELGSADGDPLDAVPALGRRGAGRDDDAAAERRRSIGEVRHCRGSRPVSSR